MSDIEIIKEKLNSMNYSFWEPKMMYSENLHYSIFWKKIRMMSLMNIQIEKSKLTYYSIQWKKILQ